MQSEGNLIAARGREHGAGGAVAEEGTRRHACSRAEERVCRHEHDFAFGYEKNIAKVDGHVFIGAVKHKNTDFPFSLHSERAAICDADARLRGSRLELGEETLVRADAQRRPCVYDQVVKGEVGEWLSW